MGKLLLNNRTRARASTRGNRRIKAGDCSALVSRSRQGPPRSGAYYFEGWLSSTKPPKDESQLQRDRRCGHVASRITFQITGMAFHFLRGMILLRKTTPIRSNTFLIKPCSLSLGGSPRLNTSSASSVSMASDFEQRWMCSRAITQQERSTSPHGEWAFQATAPLAVGMAPQDAGRIPSRR